MYENAEFMKKLSFAILVILALAGCKGRTKTEEEPAAEPEVAVEAAPLDTVAAAKVAAALPEEPVFDIVTSMGTIKVRLYKDTPKHRSNFEKLAISGYYDSLRFHRVIKDFMIQGGDPFSRDTSKIGLWGTGGPDYTVPAEFVPEYRHKKGALAAARRSDAANPFRESSGSQFYIVQNPDNCVHLDGQYTVFGETVAGLNVIDRIASVKTDRYDRPVQDIMILSIKPDPEYNSAE